MKKKIKKLIKDYEMIIGYTFEKIIGDTWTADSKLKENIILQAKEKINTLELIIKDLKMLL